MTEEELEQALRRALQPVDPGEDFVDRVAMRPDTSATERTHTSDAAGAAPSAPHERHGRRSALLGWVPVALAACAIVGIGLVRWQQETLERQRGSRSPCGAAPGAEHRQHEGQHRTCGRDSRRGAVGLSAALPCRNS